MGEGSEAYYFKHKSLRRPTSLGIGNPAPDSIMLHAVPYASKISAFRVLEITSDMSARINRADYTGDLALRKIGYGVNGGTIEE